MSLQKPLHLTGRRPYRTDVPQRRRAPLCPGLLLAAALAAAPALADTIDGEWTTGCLPIGKDGRHGFVARLEIRNGTIAATGQMYARPACDVPTVTMRYAGTLAAVAPGADGTAVDHRVSSLSLAPNTAEVAGHYNAAGDGAGCGLAGWQENRPQDVAGRFCRPFRFAAAGAVLHDRAWLDGDRLAFGGFPLDWQRLSPEQRPAQPSPVVFFRTGH